MPPGAVLYEAGEDAKFVAIVAFGSLELVAAARQCADGASALRSLEKGERTFQLGPDGRIRAEDLTFLWETFIEMDKDQSGSIDLDEFHHAMRKLGKTRISKKKAASMFRKVDTDDSGEIDFDEFVQAFTDGGAKVDEEDKEFDC